jgi:VWFA-related protein
VLAGRPPVPAQKKEQDKSGQSQKTDTREYVEVVNVGLILRALKKGKTVGGLKQEDFTLYENGKPLPLTSFKEIRRKVGQRAADEAVKSRVEEKKRLFFIFFRVTEPDPKIQEALTHFFRHVYRNEDYVLLMLENRVFSITRRARVAPVLASFYQAFINYVTETRIEKQRLTDDLNRSVNSFLDETNKNFDNPVLIEGEAFKMLSAFKAFWQAYQARYIGLPEEKLKQIATSLKKLDIEKWGLVFFQQDRLPQLNLKNIFGFRRKPPLDAAKFRKEIEIIMQDAIQTGQSTQIIRQFQRAFIDADVTFHLLLSNPTSKGKLDSDYLKYSAVYTDWQQVFRNISEATGGGIIEDNDLQGSLVKVVEREDVYYRITYAPAAGGKERRNIRIETKVPGLKLQYHRQVMLSQADKISIQSVSFNYPSLGFTMKHYRQFFDGNRLRGDIEVQVTSIDSHGDKRSFKRVIEPDSDQIAVSMNLNFPSGGKYSLVLEARDRQTGKTETVRQKITVPENKYLLEPVLVTETLEEMKGIDVKKRLDSLLEKAALYCEKLKKATFYFTCTEEINDGYWNRGNRLQEKRYIYDYQIIREESGELKEKRRVKPESPILETQEQEKGKETGQSKDGQRALTNFVSNYPYLMPINMLSQENRPKYRYRLVGTDSISGRTLYKVSVEPKQDGVMFDESHYGVVWIDEMDGTVYKIRIAPDSLGGIKQLKKLARQKRNRLKVSDVHWYEVLREGVRFPSKTEIGCSFLDWDQSKRARNRYGVTALEKVETVFEYKEYRFYKVNVDVTETVHQ